MPLLRTLGIAVGLSLGLTVAAQPAAAQGVVDSFTRPDAGALGSADTGQAWASHAGYASVQSGRAAPWFGFFLASVNAGASTLDTNVTVVTPAPEFWLVVRFQDAANYWRFGRTGGQAYVLQQIRDNAIGTPVIQTGAPVSALAGDRLWCHTRATLLECGVNGTTLARTTDTFGVAATSAGLSTYSGDAARFDDFSAVPPVGPNLSVSITGASLVDFGAVGSWQTTITNIGVSAVASADVTITPPAGVTGLAVTGASCVASGTGRRCVTGSIGVGQSVVLQVTATVPTTLQTLGLTAAALAASGETATGNNSYVFRFSTRRPIPSGALVFDAFDRANGFIGSAETGQPWSQLSGSLSIAEGAATTGSGFVLASVDSGSGAGDLTTTVVSPSSEFWVIFRQTDAANYWRFGRWSNEAYQLQRIQANGATISPILVSRTPAAGDAVRCVYWFDQVECSVNGVVVARASDAFNETAGRVGYSTYQTPSTRFDELLVRTPPARVDTKLTLTGPVTIRTSQLATWNVSVQNRGTSNTPATEVLLTVPSQLTSAGVTGAACTPNGTGYRCPVPSLIPGAVAALTLSGIATVAPATITIAASATVLSGDVLPANNTASVQTRVRPAIPTNALVLDLFDRADSTSLGTSDSGHVWTMHSPGIGVQGGEAALGAGFTMATVDTGVSGADISSTLAGNSAEFWMIFRLTDSANYWRFGRWRGEAYQLQQIRGNGLGVPAVQVLATVQPAVGDLLSCRVNAQGIDCSVNGVAVARSADTFNRTATRAGFSGYASNTARFDDFVVVNVPSGPDLSVSVLAPTVTLAGQGHTTRVTVRNNGGTSSTGATLRVTIPSGAQVTQLPGGCATVQTGIVDCPLNAALSANGVQEFVFTLNAASTGTLNGQATATLANDAFPSDNLATWTTSVETASTGVFDGFSRANTTSGLGSTLTGQSWQVLSGGFRILDGQARATSNNSLVAVNAGFAFGTLDVVLGDQADFAGIAFRIVNSQNYYRLTSDGGFYRITKVVNGQVEDLQFYLLRHQTPVQSGDVVRIISRPDDGMFVTVNGRHIIDAGDQQFMTATQWGLLSTAGTPSYRSFVLRTVLDGLGAATTDNFTGTNGYALNTPNSGVNYHWIFWMGPGMGYDNGAARPLGDGYTVGTLDTSSERASTKVKLTQPGSGGWIVFRYVEHGTYFRFGHDGGAAYKVDYYSGQDSVPLPVTVQTFANIVPQAGDQLEVRQSANGTVECFVNGVRTHRFVEPGGPGFRSTLTGLAAESSNVRFDDFISTPLPR